MNQYELWQEYTFELNGRLSEEAFFERHINVNTWIVNLMREHGSDIELSIMSLTPSSLNKEFISCVVFSFCLSEYA